MAAIVLLLTVTFGVPISCEMEIKELQKLLSPQIKGRKIVDWSLKALTAPGDNFGSTMAALDVVLQEEKEGKNEELHLVAKMYPINPLTVDSFNSTETFKKEVCFYSVVVKELEEFAGDLIDFFPKFYGGRISLKETTNIADKDAVLILENLKHQNYTLASRHNGLNLNESKYALKKLAVFHATPIALRIKKPEVFRTKILPNLKRIPMFENLPEQQWTQFQKFLLDVISQKHELQPFIRTIRSGMTFGKVYSIYGSPEVDEKFATIGHNDYWINNLLLTHDGCGEPTSLKMLDFQTLDYGSFARDLIFFVFTSIDLDVLKSHFDFLLEWYRDNFLETLRGLGCAVEGWTDAGFRGELGREAPHQLEHVLCMLRVVHMMEGGWKELEELSVEDFGVREEQLGDGFKPMVWFVVGEFVRKGWIKVD